jgi:hypothetical protein
MDRYLEIKQINGNSKILYLHLSKPGIPLKKIKYDRVSQWRFRHRSRLKYEIEQGAKYVISDQDPAILTGLYFDYGRHDGCKVGLVHLVSVRSVCRPVCPYVIADCDDPVLA